MGVTSGTGVANRINTSAPLTLGGSNGSGIFVINSGATVPVNSQSFTTLTLGLGSNQLSSSSTTNAATISLSGTSGTVYSRAVGGTVRFQALAASSLFANAPSGSSTIGSGTSAILIGAVSGGSANNTTDFVQAKAGALAAPTYTTGSSAEWASGNNTNVDGSYAVASGSTTQSLRFADAIARTVTLSGTNTIESGGILVSSAGTSGTNFGTVSTITGGTIQAASGKDLWVYTAGDPTALGNRQDLSIGSIIGDNGSSSLTKSGARVLTLTNTANTYAGGTFLNEGTLNIAAGGSLGAATGALTFGGSATLQAGAATVNLGARPITLSSGQNASFDTNGNAMLSSGVISGSGNLIKGGAGTLTLSGANTYTGQTNAQRGTLRLDFSSAGAPTSNIISSSSALTIGIYSSGTNPVSNGTLEIQGAANTSNAQSFASTVIGRGAGHLNLTAGSSGTLAVSLGSVNRNTLPGVLDAASPQGSTLDISIGSGVTVSTTSTSLTNSVFAPSGHSAITVNGNTWAALSGSNIVGLSTYATAVATNANLDVSGAALSLNANVNTLRFNANSASTLNFTAGAVRNLVAGGILVTSNVGSNLSTIGSGASGGVGGGLLAGASRRDLIIFQNNTAGDLQIDATIVDFNGGAQVNTKSGLGKVILTANNTNTGITYVNEGTMVVTGEVVAGFTKTATSTQGNATLAMTDTSNIFLGQAVTQAAALTTTNTTWTVVGITANTSVTLSNVATATTGSLTNGTFTFGGAGGLGAATSGAHVVAPGATLQIGNGGTTGTLVSTQTITNNGALILNRSNDFTFANVVSGTGTLEKQGAGNATLSVANSYTGGTKISGGSIILGNAGALGTGTLDYNSYGGSLSFGTQTTVSLGGLKGNQDLVLSNTTPAAVALTLGSNHESTTYSGNLSGLGSLTKTGGGTLTLSGNNTFQGQTQANAGTLLLTGSISGGTNLLVGNAASSPAVMTLSGSGSYTTGAASSITVGAAATVATLNVGSGTSLTAVNSGTSGGGITLGNVANSAGVINQSGGTVTVAGSLLIGNATTGYGFYNQTGGSLVHNAGAAASARFRVAPGNVSSTGVYYLSGGTASYAGPSGANIDLASTGTAVSGGINAVGVLYITGTGALSGNATTSLAIAVNNGGNSTGTNSLNGQLTIGGAGSTAASLTALSVITSNAGSNQPGSSTINLLSGGTLTTGNITKNANGTSYLNFNGGTLKVGTTSTALGSSLSGVYSYSGGATVDTNGLNYTIAASIQAPTASGISNIAITDGGADYIGAPAVVISGGSGTGATAIAEISNGRVSNIVITNPGTGYSPSDTLTVTLSGGGFSNNNTATIGSVSFASNTSGGLAKNGAGTLTLTGNNNYTGATIVNNGALQVGNAGVGKTGTGAVSVESGATIFGTGTVQGSSFTAKSGSTVQAGDSTASSSFGTLTFSPVSGTGSFDFQSGSTTILGLNLSGASDLLNFVGNGANTLNFNGNLTVGPAFFTPTGTAVFNLLDWSGLSGAPTFASRFSAGSYGSFLLGNGDDNLGFDLPDISTSGFGWDISNFVTAGSISLVVVPEPSRALLLMLGLIGLAGRRRRQ